jgi:hypothetical protein
LIASGADVEALGACPKSAPGTKKASAMIDLQSCWTMATRPFRGSRTGWKFNFSTPM